MDPIAAIVPWATRSLPAYPADAVGRAAASLGDAVTWTGPAATPETLEALGRQAASAYLFYPLAAVLLLAVTHGLVLAYRRFGDACPAAVQFALGIGFCVPVGLAGFAAIVTDQTLKNAGELSGRAYLVTPTRIVQVDGDTRTDIPASAVASVSRAADALVVRTADGRQLRIQAAPAGRAALEDALDRVVEDAGRGSRALRERHG